MRKLSYILSVAILLFGLSACGSDATGPDVGEPPAIPNLENSQPDVSYFGGAGQKVSSELPSVNFQTAQNLALTFSSFSAIEQLYSGFMQGAENSSASFQNGVWEWTYSHTYQGTNSSVRLTAEETNNAVNWDLFFSVDSPEITFEDYKMMSGSTQNDGSQGDWTFNSIFNSSGTEIPFLESMWMVDSNNNEETLDVVVYDDQGVAVATIDYSRNNNEYLMMINITDSNTSDAEIFWDTNAEIGYIMQNSERLCWQGTAQSATDVVCSDVGL